LIERLAHGRQLLAGESINDRVQNVCVRVHQKLDQFAGIHQAADDEQAWAAFVGWIKPIVFTVGANTHRRREPFAKVSIAPPSDSTGPGIDPPAADGTPSTYVRADEEALKVRAAIDGLPDPVNRDVIRLRFFDGLSLHEISDRLNLTYDVVRERYRLTKLRLRRELGELE
jgi:RNA polymerase sigma factor (sigma-70 family)